MLHNVKYRHVSVFCWHAPTSNWKSAHLSEEYSLSTKVKNTVVLVCAWAWLGPQRKLRLMAKIGTLTDRDVRIRFKLCIKKFWIPIVIIRHQRITHCKSGQ